MAEPLRLPPPNRNRLLPISIALLSGGNPRIRGFGWGRDGVGGREVVAMRCRLSRPPPKKGTPCPPHKGEGSGSRPPPQAGEGALAKSQNHSPSAGGVFPFSRGRPVRPSARISMARH